MAYTKTAGKLLEEWRSTVLLVAQTEMAKTLKFYADQHKSATFDVPDYNRLTNIIKGTVVMRLSELDLIRLVFPDKMDEKWYKKISQAIQEDTAAKIQNAKKKKAGPKAAVTQTGTVFESWLEELGLFPKELYDQLELAKYGWTVKRITDIIDGVLPMKAADIETLHKSGRLSEEYYQKFTEAIKADKADKWEKLAEEKPKREPEKKEQPRIDPKVEMIVPPIEKVEPPTKEVEMIVPPIEKVEPPTKDVEKVARPKTRNNRAAAIILGIGALLVVIVLIVSTNTPTQGSSTIPPNPTLPLLATSQQGPATQVSQPSSMTLTSVPTVGSWLHSRTPITDCYWRGTPFPKGSQITVPPSERGRGYLFTLECVDPQNLTTGIKQVATAWPVGCYCSNKECITTYPGSLGVNCANWDQPTEDHPFTCPLSSCDLTASK